MTSGRYFNKGVKALDSPDIGHVVRESHDKIVVFGRGDERYDIPISEIQQVGANVLIGLRMYDIITKYKVSRQELLPTSRQDPWGRRDTIELAAYEKRYPKSLFNKGVRAKNEDDVGHIMKETGDKIVVFGQSNYRFDIPKSHIVAVGRNVILDIDFPEIFKYQVIKDAPLPTGEPIENLNTEAYPPDDLNERGAKGDLLKQDREKTKLISSSVSYGGKKDKTSKSLTDMLMDDSYSSSKSLSSGSIAAGLDVFDTSTLVVQTQDRMEKALRGSYHYDSSLKDSQNFLFNYVNSKLSLVVMYADLVGSTDLTMTLPVDKMVTITRAFTHEMTSTVRSYGGFVLKYVGDAIIAFFPSGYNKLLACDKAVQCANSMITVIKNGINPILKQYEYPDLSIKIGIDEGQNIIVQYGNDRSSLIDILGYSMSITAKITALTSPNKITIGEDVFNILHPEIKQKFAEVKLNTLEWKYRDRETGQLYKIYSVQ